MCQALAHMMRHSDFMLNSIWNRLFQERDSKVRSDSEEACQQHTPATSNATFSDSVARAGKEQQRDGPTSSRSVFLPLSSVSGDAMIAAIGELDSMLRTPAANYEISLLGPEGLYPEFALTMYELITRRPHGGHVTVRSLGSLLNADVLVWLAGDRRIIRPNGWVQFEAPLPPRKRGWKGRPRSLDPTYDQVFKLITQKLPPEFAGREIWPSELNEWALIEQTPQFNRKEH
jgi:hypothetical protein